MPSQKFVVTTSDKQVPLATFSNGTIRKPKKRHLKLSALHDASYKGRGKRRKMLVGEWNGKTYKGDNFGPRAAPEQHTQLYVAEVNRATHQMTLFPTELFHLFHDTTASAEEPPRESSELESMSLREKTDLLTNAFGSQKKKRAMEQRLKSEVTEETVASAMGSAVDLALTTHQEHPVEQPQSTSSSVLPHNKEAKTPAEVYSLRDIIGPVEMDSLRSSAEVLKNYKAASLKEWTEKRVYHNTVLARLPTMPFDEELRAERACLLLYLQYMLSMFHFKSDQMRRRDPLPQNWPDPVKRMMLERFSVKLDGQKRCIPARVKDHLLSHILVLCLIVDGFDTFLGDLLKDLKISINRLHNHVRALGCRVKVDTSNKNTPGAKVTTSNAVLKLPLTFPDPARQRKRTR